MPKLKRFVALYDLHWGYERKGGRLHALHDERSLAVARRFIDDFRPHEVILGGDMLDCGPISHHNDRKPGRVEGLRLFRDAQELRDQVLDPLEAYARGGRGRRLTYIIGNHEAWLYQLVEAVPGLAGIVEPEQLLKLKPKRWKVVPQGGIYRLGKLVFIHGDQVRGGLWHAKKAVENAERSIRYGHHHTYQAFTKVSSVDLRHKHTGVEVPCLCNKGPAYGKGAANGWLNGFCWGYILPNGDFFDYVTVIWNGQAIINGKWYRE